MKQTANYIGWNSDGGIWILDEGNDYPRLTWQDTPGTALPTHTISDYIPGSGAIEDPYRITTAEQLNTIGRFPSSWDKVFSLDADIDLSGISGVDFNRIGLGYEPFTGTFEGNNYIISNLTYHTMGNESWIGLFGYAWNATINNIGLRNVDIFSAGSDLGGIVGYELNCIINRCYTSGKVISICSTHESCFVGGLIGYQRSGTVNLCYSMCEVSISVSSHPSTFSGSRYSVGGLSGYQYYGTISNCYAMGPVSISSSYPSYAGGLVGLQDGLSIVEKSYSFGKVTGTGVRVYAGA